MGERIQELRKDLKRRMNMSSTDLFAKLTKLKPDKRLKDDSRSNSHLLLPKDISRISVIHDSYIPVSLQDAFSQAVESIYSHSNDKVSLKNSSIQASPLIFSGETVSDEPAPDCTQGSSMDSAYDNTPYTTYESCTTISQPEDIAPEDIALASEDIALIERPLSQRESLEFLLLENREKAIIPHDHPPQNYPAPPSSKSRSYTRLSRKELMRPLPECPLSKNETIQTLRQDILAKAKELQEVKQKLEVEIANIRQEYAVQGSSEAVYTRTNLSSRCEDNFKDDNRLHAKLQWIERETNLLRIENGIMSKEVEKKKSLETELQDLKDENHNLTEELARLDELNRRVFELESNSTIRLLDEIQADTRKICHEQDATANSALSLSKLPTADLEWRNHELNMEMEIHDLQEQLDSVTSNLQQDWDVERHQLCERIQLLGEDLHKTDNELKEERLRRIFCEEECLRVTSSYNALSESLTQQRERFHFQLQTIEHKLAAIDTTRSIQSTIDIDLSESIVAQQNLWKGHRQLFQLQEHYMKGLEKLHSDMRAYPEKVKVGRDQLQEALSSIRNILVLNYTNQQVEGAASHTAVPH